MAGSYRGRLRRLEQWGRQRVRAGRQPHGVSEEEIRQKFLEMPRRIAEEALRLREDWLRGVSPSEPDGQMPGWQKNARVVLIWAELGLDHVPDAWLERRAPPRELTDEGVELWNRLSAAPMRAAYEAYREEVAKLASLDEHEREE